jgi:PAS domain S-box-containing protein/diguanylate cyclase (GGDEF)-like protein
MIFPEPDVSMTEISDPQLFRTILDELPTGVYLLDRERRVRFWNTGAERITGYLRQQVLGQHCRQSFFEGCNEQHCELCGSACSFAQVFHSGQARESNVLFRHAQGEHIPIHLWNAPIRDDRGSIAGVVGSFHRRRQAPAQQRRQNNLAIYGCMDEASGVANRGFTEFQLRENFCGLREYHIPFGIILIQMNGLPAVTRQYGKPAADALVQLAARTVTINVRSSELLGRWADDQLLLIARVCAFPHLEFIAQRLRQHLAILPLHWWGQTITVEPAVGSAGAEPCDAVETLLGRAQHSLRGAEKSRSAAP